MRKLVGEALGAFLLVLGGGGTALLAARFATIGIGLAGVAFAFGLSLLAGVYAIGPISGAHFSPALSLGLACARRFSWRDLPGYVGAQLLGAVVAAGLLVAVAGTHAAGLVGGPALLALWLLWLAPLTAAFVAGGLARWLQAVTPRAMNGRGECRLD
jgi:aquaporin Z